MRRACSARARHPTPAAPPAGVGSSRCGRAGRAAAAAHGARFQPRLGAQLHPSCPALLAQPPAPAHGGRLENATLTPSAIVWWGRGSSTMCNGRAAGRAGLSSCARPAPAPAAPARGAFYRSSGAVCWADGRVPGHTRASAHRGPTALLPQLCCRRLRTGSMARLLLAGYRPPAPNPPFPSQRSCGSPQTHNAEELTCGSWLLPARRSPGPRQGPRARAGCKTARTPPRRKGGGGCSWPALGTTCTGRESWVWGACGWRGGVRARLQVPSPTAATSAPPPCPRRCAALRGSSCAYPPAPWLPTGATTSPPTQTPQCKARALRPHRRARHGRALAHADLVQGPWPRPVWCAPGAPHAACCKASRLCARCARGAGPCIRTLTLCACARRRSGGWRVSCGVPLLGRVVHRPAAQHLPGPQGAACLPGAAQHDGGQPRHRFVGHRQPVHAPRRQRAAPGGAAPDFGVGTLCSAVCAVCAPAAALDLLGVAARGTDTGRLLPGSAARGPVSLAAVPAGQVGATEAGARRGPPLSCDPLCSCCGAGVCAAAWSRYPAWTRRCASSSTR